MSPASVRVRDMFGILGWGSSRKFASRLASKSGRLAMAANGGASPVGRCWLAATTWQVAHQRRASVWPWSGSAAFAATLPSAVTASTGIAQIFNVRIFIAHLRCRSRKHAPVLGVGNIRRVIPRGHIDVAQTTAGFGCVRLDQAQDETALGPGPASRMSAINAMRTRSDRLEACILAIRLAR